MTQTDTAVRLEDITKRFPGVVANDNVDLHVERGSVHALLGENGAGKTTLMNVLYGLYQPNSGRVVVDGEPREFDSPRDAIDAGIGMIHQHFMLVDTMTVAENIALGNEPRKWGGLAVDREAARREVVELSERYGFDVDPDQTIADVSVGVQQRVEILKALYRGADVLILDEPTAVLTPQEVEDLFGVLDELTDQGKTVIFITHKLGEAMHAADDVTVLRDGENVGTVDADETTREELAELMVGREVVLDVESTPPDVGETVLDVDSLSVLDDRDVPAVTDVSFAVREGEVFGVAGVDGNGQAELVEAITGLREPEAGTVEFDGRDFTDAPRRERIDGGMAYIPEDRQERGLVMDFDLVENGILGSQHGEPFAGSGTIDWDASREHAEAIVEEYDVRPPNADNDAVSLSGGNQQKFIVGREFERDPRLVVATHPTRGVDIGSQEFIHDRLLELRDEGRGVLLVSSKLDEVQGLSDRLAVMHDGDVMAVVDPDDVTEEELGLLMAGEHPEGYEPRSERDAKGVAQ
ncbi:ABC-type transport system ATP-binding protein (probable substrate sugar) [Halobacterium hubeiense]|uniref:ABC-type transport system ATP-binding protein (Probable substrate sugar) n=1 Tax=Halobacterium hubeiense TaxID=1407499 RepID=A0A0U5H0Y2_9EURY|nr:ABC transporter ATP-binding protein [Halobacterium hubeiense]CQH53809.1 ABC-type transport system ATP-binding protein (probable substrate sugar) [Halobacterium hubeiense]